MTVDNTAQCESLPSQIENFTAQFFGTIEKTEVNGVVSWILPCNLDVGLPGNPRAEGEGLACLFLRYFSEGISGLKGDPGAPGATGAPGLNAYTVVTQSFTHPALGGVVNVLTSYNPGILSGMFVFIQNSGWYLVNNADTSGLLSLTLEAQVVSPATTIIAGKLVIPAGFQGESITGPPGEKGDKGDTGSAGESFTVNNGLYFAPVGTDYPLQVTYDAINFTNSSPSILLTKRGKYLVNACVDVKGQGSVMPTDATAVKLRNTTNSADVAGSEHTISNLAVDEFSQIVISTIVETDGDNQTVALFGKCTTAGAVKAVAANTTLNFVRLS